TVVLAAVLYVMVSGLLTPVGNGPQIMGVALSKTGDGKNWSLEIASTPLGLTPGSVHLELISPGGQTAVYKTFSALSWPAVAAVADGFPSRCRGGVVLAALLSPVPHGELHELEDGSQAVREQLPRELLLLARVPADDGARLVREVSRPEFHPERHAARLPIV